ncbi:ribonuclease III [Nemania sp. FL0916]|nr:ribonuclease III [Nemania sp. FL0916]
MKRIRLDHVSRQCWRASTPTRPSAGSCSSRISRLSRSSAAAPAATLHQHQRRCQSTATSLSPDAIFDEASDRSVSSTTASTDPEPSTLAPPLPSSLPSPHPDKALRSAKLAALHARLSLSSKIPLQILARALVDPSADPHPQFNNANLAFVGASLLQYHTSEFLVTRFPRLPMSIVFAAMKGYAGERALHRIARAWGVEAAAAPGEEVDPGYLQFASDKPTMSMHRWGYARAEAKELEKYKWRRGMTSRIVTDDPFGDLVQDEPKRKAESEAGNNQNGAYSDEEYNRKELIVQDSEYNAHANFVRAVIGAIYLHRGSDTAKLFIMSHVLSRQLDLSNMFNIRLPQRELTRLCARENFSPPVARLLSETGRASRTPVFVVGIYSGYDKLGEAANATLESAKTAACINALKSWYLYSPGQDVNLPSDTFAEDAEPWKPLYVDLGEIVV